MLLLDVDAAAAMPRTAVGMSRRPYRRPAPVLVDKPIPPPPHLSPPSDGVLLPIVHDLIRPYVEAAQRHGPLPPVRSEEWYDADPEVQLASLLVLGAAWLVSDPHRVIRNALKQVSTDIHSGRPRGYWARSADEPSFEELQRRRGVERGPDGQWRAARRAS